MGNVQYRAFSSLALRNLLSQRVHQAVEMETPEGSIQRAKNIVQVCGKQNKSIEATPTETIT